MRKISLLSCTMLLSLFFIQEGKGQCTDTTIDCQALGYTKSSCETGGVRCPTENLWYCPSSSSNTCQIGDILNSDMSCTSNVEIGKIPIGVVVYFNGIGGGQAIALNEISAKKMKSNNIWEKKLGLKYPTNSHYDFASCTNTKAYLNAGDSSQYPAAWAVNDYAPTNASETKGKWCLPAYGIFYHIDFNRDTINNKLIELGATPIQRSKYYPYIYWNSTIYTIYDDNSFTIYNSEGDSTSPDKELTIRPIIEF